MLRINWLTAFSFLALSLAGCATESTRFEQVWKSVEVGDSVDSIENELTHEYMLSVDMLVWRSQVVGGSGKLQYFETRLMETQDPNDLIPKPDTQMFQIEFDKNLVVTGKRVDSYQNLYSDSAPCEE